MKLYVAGPMSGKPEHNFPAFNKATEQLRELGHEVFNPADQGEGDWHELLKRDIQEVCKSDAIVLLPGWIESKGARLEFDTARALNIPAYFIEDFISDHQNAVTLK